MVSMYFRLVRELSSLPTYSSARILSKACLSPLILASVQSFSSLVSCARTSAESVGTSSVEVGEASGVGLTDVTGREGDGCGRLSFLEARRNPGTVNAATIATTTIERIARIPITHAQSLRFGAAGPTRGAGGGRGVPAARGSVG